MNVVKLDKTYPEQHGLIKSTLTDFMTILNSPRNLQDITLEKTKSTVTYKFIGTPKTSLPDKMVVITFADYKTDEWENFSHYQVTAD